MSHTFESLYWCTCHMLVRPFTHFSSGKKQSPGLDSTNNPISKISIILIKIYAVANRNLDPDHCHFNNRIICRTVEAIKWSLL